MPQGRGTAKCLEVSVATTQQEQKQQYIQKDCSRGNTSDFYEGRSRFESVPEHYPEVLRGIPLPLPEDAGIVRQIRPRPLSSAPHSINYSTLYSLY